MSVWETAESARKRSAASTGGSQNQIAAMENQIATALNEQIKDDSHAGLYYTIFERPLPRTARKAGTHRDKIKAAMASAAINLKSRGFDVVGAHISQNSLKFTITWKPRDEPQKDCLAENR